MYHICTIFEGPVAENPFFPGAGPGSAFESRFDLHEPGRSQRNDRES